MRTIRWVLAVVAAVLAIYATTELDYANLSWSANRSSYLVIVMGLTGAFNLLFPDIHNAIKRNKG